MRTSLRHGRAIELSPKNIIRWRHALFPPSADEIERVYEKDGFERCEEYLEQVRSTAGAA